MDLRLLVLGGTRLVGRAFVEKMIAAGNEITAVSRHPEMCPEGAKAVGAERREGLTRLAGSKFDATLDFICYDGWGPSEVFSVVDPGNYILISTVWMGRLVRGLRLDEAVPDSFSVCVVDIPENVFRYLLGKLYAERTTLAKRRAGAPATILRLPIVWAAQEHSGRLDFYRNRLADGAPLILVNGGSNLAQIAWSEDLANVVTRWVSSGAAISRPIWEALPDLGNSVRDILANLASCMGVKPKFVDLTQKRIEEDLPAYLEAEPFWRERAAQVTGCNVFAATGMKPTPPPRWFATLVQGPSQQKEPALRAAEISCLKRLGHVF